MYKFLKPCSGDICSWFRESGVADQVIRYWVNGINGNDDEPCLYGRIRHMFTLPNGEVMVGINACDDPADADSDAYLCFFYLSDLCIQWSGEDQNELDGETWLNRKETKLMS